MPVPEYKVESLYLGTKVGIRSLCAHRFCYLILRTSSALYSLLRSCIKMASDKAKCSIYVQSHIYGSEGVNATPFEPLARHWFPGTKRNSPNFSHLVWNPANLRLSSGPNISSRWFHWNAFIRILANCLLNHPPKLRQFFLLQNDTCFTKLCRPGVSKCDRCAMDLVLQSAMIIRNCDITALEPIFHTVVSPKSSLSLSFCFVQGHYFGSDTFHFWISHTWTDLSLL